MQQEKLYEIKVRNQKMYALMLQGMNHREIGKMYGITGSRVGQIVRRIEYKVKPKKKNTTQ